MLVKKPVDVLVQLDSFSTQVSDDVREFYYAGIGSIMVAPSSYKLKSSDIFALNVSDVHPAWYYSGKNYSDDYLNLLGKYRHYTSDEGIDANIHINNIKKSTITSSQAGDLLPTTSDYQMMDNIPVHYFGKHANKKKPTDAGYTTFLTSVIDESFIKVTCLSPWEYEIEVLQDLTEDQWFYLPDSNAKGLPNTMFGKVGSDSTLPAGASCGLLKVRSEAMLDARSGCYLVTGSQYSAVTMPTTTIFKDSYDTRSGHPSWMLNFMDVTLPNLDQYKILEDMVNNNTPYFACGYKMGCCTVGTGIFVRNENEVTALPFGVVSNGLSYKRTEKQNESSPREKYTIGEMLDCGTDFLYSLATCGSSTEKIPDGAVIPFCASEIQYDSKAEAPAPYKAPTYTGYKYAYPVEETLLPASVTPTYIPNASTITCYMPKLHNGSSTIVSMLSANDLNSEVTAYLYPTRDWINVTTGTKTPRELIKPSSSMSYVNNDDPTNGAHRNIFGFNEVHSMSEYYTGYYSQYHWYRGSAEVVWNNPSVDPTIGEDAANGNYTNNVMVSGIIMAFMGFFPAGTPKGKYLWKPFKTVETSTGCLVSIDTEYVSAPMKASLLTDSTTAPYIGWNIVTAETAGLKWVTELVTDSDNNYKFWQVLLGMSTSQADSKSICDTRYVTINVDESALIGYPIAERPMLIDIEDWSGDHACDIGDLVVTGPIFDKETQNWEVIAASIKLKKLYRIDVEVSDEGNYVTKFLRVRDSRELFDTPYGQFSEILGLAYTTDIHYLEKPRTVDEMNEYAADVLFLVDDSLEMETMIGVLKENVDDLLLKFDEKGIRHIKVGLAAYDTQQMAIPLPGTNDVYWADDISKASTLLKEIEPQITGSSEYMSHHWTAINWAIDNYIWDKEYRVKQIILVTNADFEGDEMIEGTVQNRLKAEKINLNVITDKTRYFGQIVNETDGLLLDSGSGANWGSKMVEHMGDFVTNAVEYAYRVIAEEGAIVFYGTTEEDVSSSTGGSNLIAGTFRTNMEWDVNKDTICRLRINGPNDESYPFNTNINLPKGVAVMYPYVYILGYTWVSSPTNPVLDPAVESAGNIRLTGGGWQMSMWKMDITSGLSNNVIQVQDATDMRFTFGIPAKDKDAANMWRNDHRRLGGGMKYTWGNNPNVLPTSASLPLRSNPNEYPALAGLFCVSGQLVAFSNYHEKLVVINPVTGCIEETGTNIFPFSYPCNLSICSSGDVITTVSKFGGKNFYTAQPFFHICIGDGLIPNKYGTGIDIQDITKGHSLVRRCKIKNNLLRDSLEDVYIIVPEPEKLPGSAMLWVSLTGEDADKAKSIHIPGPILPCETDTFYVHVAPGLQELDASLILYVNSKFSRITVFFGYRNK